MKRWIGGAVLAVSWAASAWAQGADGGVFLEPAQSQPEATAPTQTLGGVSVPAVAGFKNAELFGYLKVGYYAQVPWSSQDALIGSRNGFRMANARVGVDMKPLTDFQVLISLEGAYPTPSATDPLTGGRLVALADAFVEWKASRFAWLRVGQFKAPFDGESLLPDGALPFMWRSIITDGIAPPDGYARAGLTLDRQVGAQVSSDRLGDTVGVSYAAAVVNGNGPNQLFNDNGSPAYVGRATVHFKDLVELGLNANYNQQTLGTVGSLVTQNQLTWGADVTFHYAGFNAFVLYLGRSTTHPDGLPSERATGVMGSLRYTHAASGLEGGVRYTFYDPSNVQTGDQLTELNVMVGYRAKVVPARILVQYTVRGQEASVAVASNSLDGMVQVTF